MKISSFHRFFHYARAERIVLIRAFAISGLIRLGLWIFPFNTVLKLVSSINPKPRRELDPSIPVPLVIWAVKIVNFHIPRSTCLVQALASQAMLALEGVHSCLCIGVSKGQESFIDAHAWLEVDGKAVIGEPEPGRFTRLTGIGTSPE